MTPAAKLQKYLRERVEALGGQYRGVEWKARWGCPDCFVWFVGRRFAFIEVKAGNDQLRPEQKREIDRMTGDGIPVFIVRDERDIDETLQVILNG